VEGIAGNRNVCVGWQVMNSRVPGHGIRIVLYALVGLVTVVVLLK
jgi:hypothetical protein